MSGDARRVLDAAPCRNQCAGGHECVCLRGHQAPCICRNPACQCHTAANYRLVMITQRGRAVYVPQDAAWAVMEVEE